MVYLQQPMEILALFGTFAAIAQYINYRFIKLPPAVGITLAGLLSILILKMVDGLFSQFHILDLHSLEEGLMSLDFKKVLLDVSISFLLFASAINFEIMNLKKWWKQITLLATVSVIISTIVIGAIMYGLLNLIAPNIDIPFWFCMLFGAYMSPTDPIAAVAVFKNLAQSRAKQSNPDGTLVANLAKHIEVKLLGESLFNDGTGIWLFMAISAVLLGKEQTILSLGLSLTQEIFGAILVGLLLGAVGKFLIKKSDVISVIMFTISLTALTYILSTTLHVSAPIAVVIAGLIIGHNIRKLFEHEEEHQIKLFWEYVDEIINVMLFALMSLIVLFIDWSLELVILGLITFPVIVFVRWVSVKLTFLNMVKKGQALQSSINIVSWGGIRGGISLALALSILNTPYGNQLVGITFVCVILSNLIQRMTLKHIIAAYYPNPVSSLNSIDVNSLSPSEKWKYQLDNIIQKMFNTLNPNYQNDLNMVLLSQDSNKIPSMSECNSNSQSYSNVDIIDEDKSENEVMNLATQFVESALGLDGNSGIDEEIIKSNETF